MPLSPGPLPTAHCPRPDNHCPLPPKAKDLDVPATVQSGKQSGSVADTAAVIEEESAPKPKLIVTTTVQPLTEDESAVVYGTTKSSYFDNTFRTVRLDSY
jgi:hypothetical protein